MPSATPAPGSRASPSYLGPLVLLIVSVIINYADRGNLSVAATKLKPELGLSVHELSLLLSAFFWSYAFFHFGSGWLVDRHDARWVLAGGFVAWSLATAATGWAGGFASLFALRLTVGVGESVAYPAYSKLFNGYFDENRRGVANALIDVGTKVGSMLGNLLGGLLVAGFGWRPLFWVLGFGAMAWLPFWIASSRRHPPAIPPAEGPGPGVRDILRRRSAWATFVGLFCANYLWYFLLTWLPLYLVNERHFSVTRMAWLGMLPYAATATATVAASWLSFRAIARGATPTRVRKTCTGAGLALASVIAVVPAISDATLAMAILMVACMGYGTYCSSHWAITQTLAGPRACGRWTGIQNFAGNLAGVAAPIVTGLVVGQSGRFFWAFVVIAAVVFCGSLNYLFFLPRVEPEEWAAAPAR